MAKAEYSTVDEYIATFPADVQEALQTVRKVIQKAIPEAEEVISYSIPAYRFHGPVIYFSAYTKHLSISAVPETIEAFKTEMAGYKVSKSQFQIPHGADIPVDLITRMAQWRVAQNERQSRKI